MKPDWTPLRAELALWRQAGLTLPLWWRDDDAVTVTPQLEQLTELSNTLGLPVHLAVIPQTAQTDLADFLRVNPQLTPVVHGWAHTNHAPADEKKAEFRLHRPLETLSTEAEAGLNRLQDLFGESLVPMFVPPWNRITGEVIAELPKLGYRFLSTATPRKSAYPADGLAQVNTHLDPIDWRGTRSLKDPDALIEQTVGLLKDRREGHSDNDEPFGVLTHHLVHDPDIWAFTRDLIAQLLEGPCHLWTAHDTSEIQGDPA
ncbi:MULTISPECIES: polysaccharide deacetylase family protein [unclassified Ruegeria]|uniref:polysaccharide deacetylase family protein n=1 Tax=unclassified Ruegeria TaxID=2625375 RepID=UPI00148925F3|nr:MULTISPECIES: polysaccharide deacetylase family protein [unclassified Ruegeria]